MSSVSFKVFKEYRNKPILKHHVDESTPKFYESIILDVDGLQKKSSKGLQKDSKSRIESKLQELSTQNLELLSSVSKSSELEKSFSCHCVDPDDDDESIETCEAEGFGSILEDSILEMFILNTCNTGLMFLKTQCDLEIHKSHKYGVILPEKDANDTLANVNLDDLASEENKIKKLDADREFLNDVLLDTYEYICQNLSIKPIVNKMRQIRQDEEDLQNLILEEEKNKNKSREMAKQLRNQRNYNKTQVYANDMEIETLETQIEDANLMSSIRTRHVKNWQKARFEQQNTLAEKGFEMNTIDTKMADCEARVHEEIMALLDLQYEDQLKYIETWMEKYDVDIENIEKKIAVVKVNYETTHTKNDKLENTLEKHIWEIAQWKEFVDKRTAANQYVKTMTTSAVIVQSWWRGLLVRMCWGPFHVKGKKGKKGKKKK